MMIDRFCGGGLKALRDMNAPSSSRTRGAPRGIAMFAAFIAAPGSQPRIFAYSVIAVAPQRPALEKSRVG